MNPPKEDQSAGQETVHALDGQDCRIEELAREGVLRRYQQAVQRRIERGEAVPIKLSEFLGAKR